MSEVLAPPLTAKRRAILDAAAWLFLQRGFGAVSMDAVARQAEVSKATLYAYFEGKEALFSAVIAERCLDMAREAEALTPGDGPPEQGLARLGRLMLGFLLRAETMGIFRVIVAEGGRFPALARIFEEQGPAVTRRWLARWLAEEQRLGLLRADADPAEAAMVFSALVRGDVHLRALFGLGDPTEEEVERAVARAVSVFLRAYGAAGSGRASATPAA